MGRLWGDMSRYELDVRLVREMGRYGEIWGDTVREMYQEIWRDMARYGEIWRDMGRCGRFASPLEASCGEWWKGEGGVTEPSTTYEGRSGEIWGDLGRSGNPRQPQSQYPQRVYPRQRMPRNAVEYGGTRVLSSAGLDTRTRIPAPRLDNRARRCQRVGAARARSRRRHQLPGKKKSIRSEQRQCVATERAGGAERGE